ncbi:hypothetical protein Btru_072219 [Bulinus truncatus]|nr:hypothetical protein Btru_072219 [Bulinus truncatus]
MKNSLFALVCLLSHPWMSSGCFEGCMQKFMTEFTSFSSNDTIMGGLRAGTNFCSLMANQITCLNSVTPQCPPERKVLVQNMLAISIFPDYQRTCVNQNPDGNLSLTQGNVTSGSGTVQTFTPTSGRLLLVCGEKMSGCQRRFNQSVSSDGTIRNISDLCQSLKEFTLCYVDLLSSDCGHLVNRNLVKAMQERHGGMCSEDAQVNTKTLMECANRTVKCYGNFNSTFTPAAGDYNLMLMCSSFGNYTKCMQDISATGQCAQFTSQTLLTIGQLKNRYHAYCGDDNGQTAMLCAENFHNCYSQFNKTFFPAFHSGDLPLMCSSLDRYDPVCRCCHLYVASSWVKWSSLSSFSTYSSGKNATRVKILKLSNCSEVTKCSTTFMSNFTSIPTNKTFCRSFGEYFQCVAKGLDACKLPQSTTDVSFTSLGTLMQDYCLNVSSNQKLLKCQSFVKCTTAVSVSFTPTIKSLFEGSTWCTFMQLNVGCAEHALQSSGCFLEDDIKLQQYIDSLDRTRMTMCHKDLYDHTDHTEGHQGGHGRCAQLPWGSTHSPDRLAQNVKVKVRTQQHTCLMFLLCVCLYLIDFRSGAC